MGEARNLHHERPMLLRSSIAIVALVVTTSCTAETDSVADTRIPIADEAMLDTAAVAPGPATISDSIATDLIDPDIAPAIAGQDGWDYSQAAEADLTGDGEPERIVLTVRVEMYRGRPAWDDGQPWQVYVESPDGERTYLYARRLQLGTLTMRVTEPEDSAPASVILLEHLPDRLAIYESVYNAPGSATTHVRFTRALDPRGETASPQLP